ncbi:MAG: DegQ family serine endoprotease [Leptospirillia bacterium]
MHIRRGIWIVLLMVMLFSGALMPSQSHSGVPQVDDASPLPTLAPMLEHVMPGVVNISTRSHVQMQQNPLFNDPFFRRFFNVPNMPRQQERQSLGSGVIIDAASGHIVTNHHVIQGADEVTVTLRDGRNFKATVVGSDPEADLGIIRIEADNLVAVPLADSEQLRVGDFVVAIGNPFGLGQTVTSGIVSALGRSGLGIEGYEDFIQTDASINPGNSGGALVNLKGELVGINTAIVGPSGGNVGIGFAIPANMAQSIMDQLIEYGEVRRGQLGVIVQNLTPDLADIFDLPPSSGVVISQVLEDSPAEEAGLKAGDVVTEVNGEPVHGVMDLRNAIGLQRIGSVVRLKVIRDGRKKSFEAVILGGVGKQAAAESIDPRMEGAVLGPIAPNHPLAGKVSGVEVLEISRNSSAWDAGLRKGDIITSVNRKPVETVAELERAIKKGGKALLLHIRRGNSALYMVIP